MQGILYHLLAAALQLGHTRIWEQGRTPEKQRCGNRSRKKTQSGWEYAFLKNQYSCQTFMGAGRWERQKCQETQQVWWAVAKAQKRSKSCWRKQHVEERDDLEGPLQAPQSLPHLQLELSGRSIWSRSSRARLPEWQWCSSSKCYPIHITQALAPITFFTHVGKVDPNRFLLDQHLCSKTIIHPTNQAAK